MKKHLATILTPILIIGSTISFNSCSSEKKENEVKSNKTEVKKQEVRNEVLRSYDKNTPLLWDYIRKDEKLVKKIFNASGNSFYFKPNRSYNNESVHIYVTYNANQSLKECLEFLFIEAKADSIENKNFLNSNGTLKHLHKNEFNINKKHQNRVNNHNIKWPIAQKRIKRWSDSTTRNNWITNQFKTSDTTIFQAFSVDGVDFEAGMNHLCYLALKDTVINGDSTHVAELIIVNSRTGEPISLVESKGGSQNVEDLTTPTPPFGRNGFGLLESLQR